VAASGIGVSETAASTGVGGLCGVGGDAVRAPHAATNAKQVIPVTRVVLDISLPMKNSTPQTLYPSFVLSNDAPNGQNVAADGQERGPRL
jgi:hypothetical protein